MIMSQLEKVHAGRKEIILPNDVVDSCTTESIDLQEDIHEEYKQSSIESSPPVHPCLKTREDEQQIIPIGGEGQGEDIQGDLSEDPVVLNRCDEHGHKGKHDRHSMQDEPFLESQSKAQVEVMIVKHLVQTDAETFNRALEFPRGDHREKIKNFKTDLMMLK